MQLCRSHLAFYACLNRGERTLNFELHKRSVEPPVDHYPCLARAEIHRECPNADHCGYEHARAGIKVPE